MRATILCYHKVGPGREEGRRLNVEPSRLETHVRFFARRRAPFVLARDLASPWPAGLVCLTFDDAYLSTMRHAPDVLERHGARGTFYAVSERVGKTSDWDGDAARPLADWPLLRAAQERGHEIGNHTANHPFMDRLSLEEQAREVETADARLRAEGLNPGSFCYPYGALNDGAVLAVERAGYEVGLALRKRPADSEEDRRRLSRVVVAYGDALPLLLYRIHVRPRLRSRRR